MVRLFSIEGRGVIVASKEYCQGDFVLQYSGELTDHTTAELRRMKNTLKECTRFGCPVNHSSVLPKLRTRIIDVDGFS